MKKILKVIFYVMLIVAIFMPNLSLAADPSSDDVINKGRQFIQSGKNNYSVNDDDLANIIIPIARILVSVGLVVIVVATAIMGIKYMAATPDKRAQLKTQLIGLVVATIVIFGAQFIWSTLYIFFNDL